MSLWEVLGQYPNVLKVFVIGCFIIIGFIIFLIASKLGWIKSFKISKGGIDVEAAQKAEQKRYESGNLHNVMNQQIHKIDLDMMDYVLNRSNNIRRSMSKQLTQAVTCVSSRRALAACLRYPLYEASRRNNFKYVMRPENIKHYIDRLMKEISAEYEEYSIEVDNNTCPVDLQRNCKPLPPLEEVYQSLKQQLIDHWALPIRMEQLKTHFKKIETYKQFAPMFEQLNDKVMKLVCENCIDKNKVYAAALQRTPEVNEL